ncbi:hypothetical protein BCEN4_150079 [Burkholderia cenocepacia]|nr:hypothetical protein BCEN4_150079 [Burkholderia cenocepacia]
MLRALQARRRAEPGTVRLLLVGPEDHRSGLTAAVGFSARARGNVCKQGPRAGRAAF